ncbi:rhodanese-like domain-containing protein [Marinilongibacter aquaticus]|uniref:rhodanese-like domain-containing protein n=1 Tax=Marinilongibacter aquaticus TaxID=2975157 RepID=UPI0021BD1B1E|nr:rhodanese-like domain-containing protein [Marinilongibacter aquaticus]UBM60585.1 rhodanese-like domain-containing protein [Marinilongibacter aquaticus]
MDTQTILQNGKGSIVDVRTTQEFMGGHVAGSKNIPLMEIPQRMDELKALPQPLVLCCASGNRSGQATHFLKAQGFECYNGGSWVDVNFLTTTTV